MTGFNFEELTPEERLVAEQAVLNLRALNKACDAAPDGTVLDVCETLALRQGREAIRQAVETSLNRQARELEKKMRPTASAPAEGGDVTGDARDAH